MPGRTDPLSEFERRTLGNVPAYRDLSVPLVVVDLDKNNEPIQKPDGSFQTHEEDYATHVREANGYAADWQPSLAIRTADLAARLTEDESTYSPGGDQSVTGEHVEEVLTELQDRGLAKLTGDGWTMTSEGYDALNADTDENPGADA